jgi:RNA polymerase sigma-70 factor (ECF subfamily)
VEGAIPLTDGELMIAVRDGQVERLGELFERHHQRLYGFFTRLTGNLSASQDLVQEVFVRMLKYRHTYRSEGSFPAWMFTLARHAAADRWARERDLQAADAFGSAGEPGDEDDPLDRLPSAEPSPAERADTDERARRLRRAILSLAPEKRELILMARFRYLPYDQIAERLGTTVGAVKVRVHRTLKELHALLTVDALPQGKEASR